MITSASPMAISRSRLHTRISFRRLFPVGVLAGGVTSAATGASAVTAPGVVLETEDSEVPGFSGDVEGAGCFSSERSICCRLVFIARASQPAPVAILPTHTKKQQRRDGTPSKIHAICWRVAPARQLVLPNWPSLEQENLQRRSRRLLKTLPLFMTNST